MLNPYQIIQRPVVTEKSTFVSAKLGKVTLAVHPDANKQQIKEAVQQLFKVKVTAVNTMPVRPKARRRGRVEGQTAAWKKAIITLADGQKIEGL